MRKGKIETVPKIWLSKDEAKAYLGCGDDYLDKLREDAKVSFSKDGKMIWYDLNSINKFLNKMRVVF